ncbi:MAG: aryl-sulfate sulfohydrolase [Isosphaera sp.]|nr:aryl-sulfate sulfohydrolase [Isosphaera sp.]
MSQLRLAGLVAVVALGSAPRLGAAAPNVVFILADDLGWTDLGCQGSKFYETPNIDRLAAQGMRFTSGYTCGPNCQPTRAALMSGRYGPRTGVYTVGGIDRFDWSSRPLRPVDNVTKLDPKVVTVAESLKKAGYATAHFGKWHLGEDPEHHPLAQGFDESVVSMGKHFDFATNPKTAYPKGTYLADFLTDKAVDFIGRHKDRPFLLCLHHFGVHSPHEAKPELIAKFKDKPGVGGHRDPVYAAMIASVDESVGRVLKALDDLKLSENTLVVFTADNGGVGGDRFDGNKPGGKGGITDNAPLRAGKGSLYEGGVRVAYLFRWPGKVAAGATTGEPINSVDLYPTLLEVSGAKAPDGPLDGVSYLPTLLGKPRDRGPLYWHFPGYLGQGKGQWRTTPAGSVRDGDWKLIEFFEDGRRELYNLKDDIGEAKDLAAANPEKAKELHGKLAAWRTAVGAKMPTPNKK